MAARPELKRGTPRCRTHRHGGGAAGAGAGSQGGGAASEAGWFPWPHHACLSFSSFFLIKKKKFFLPPQTSWEDPAGPMGAAPQRAANGAGGAGEAGGPTEGQVVGLLGRRRDPRFTASFVPKKSPLPPGDKGRKAAQRGLQAQVCRSPPRSPFRPCASVFPSGKWA